MAAMQAAATAGRMRRREQKRPGAMVEEVDERRRAGDVAAEHADGLRQRAHLHVHPPVHAEMIDRSAAVRAEHAARVGIVDHHDAAEFLGERAEGGQRPEVAVHAEDAVGDEELPLLRRQRAENGARGVHVFVRKHLDRRAARAGSRR